VLRDVRANTKITAIALKGCGISMPTTPNTLTPRAPSAPETVVERAKRILSGGVRDDDYLKASADLRARVDEETSHISTANKIELPPETRQWMLDNYTLQHYHSGREVACWRTGTGVIVLAAGAEEVNEVLNAITPEQRNNIVIEYP
jgi:hypothetical protein